MSSSYHTRLCSMTPGPQHPRTSISKCPGAVEISHWSKELQTKAGKLSFSKFLSNAIVRETSPVAFGINENALYASGWGSTVRTKKPLLPCVSQKQKRFQVKKKSLLWNMVPEAVSKPLKRGNRNYHSLKVGEKDVRLQRCLKAHYQWLLMKYFLWPQKTTGTCCLSKLNLNTALLLDQSCKSNITCAYLDDVFILFTFIWLFGLCTGCPMSLISLTEYWRRGSLRVPHSFQVFLYIVHSWIIHQMCIVVFRISMAPIDSCVWVLGPWGMARLGAVALLEAVCHYGGGLWGHLCSSSTQCRTPVSSRLPSNQNIDRSKTMSAHILPCFHEDNRLNL